MKRFLLCALLVAGCRNSFDPASFVTGLRVLAIKSEPPELAPGQTATVTPLVVDLSDFDGGMNSWTVDWWLCLETPNPGSSVGADCVAADAGTSLQPLGRGPTMQVTMPDIQPAQLGLPDDSGGVYLPVVLHVSDGTQTLAAVYRLRYSLFPLYPNHNPVIDDVEVVPDDDAGAPASLSQDPPVELHAGDQIKLRTSVQAGSAEIYPMIEGQLNLPDGGLSLSALGDGGLQFYDGGVRVDGTDIPLVQELLPVSWFTTIGSLSPDTTGAAAPDLTTVDKPDTTLKLDAKHTPPAPADIDLYVVVRDTRGGTAWTQRRLLLR